MSLKLSDIVPNVTQQSTVGAFDFHDRAGDHWVILSHPHDFTHVCAGQA